MLEERVEVGGKVYTEIFHTFGFPVKGALTGRQLIGEQ